MAMLLSERLQNQQYSDQIIIFNYGNCVKSPGERATVKFYIAVSNFTTEPSQPLTKLAAQILAELIKNDKTVAIGANFGEGTVSKNYFS